MTPARDACDVRDVSAVGKQLRLVAAVWAISRTWLALCAYAGHRAHPFHESIVGGYAGVSNWWLNVWTTYDSTYFLEIARDGYRPLTSAFFPLYPLLLHPFSSDENAAALAGVVISNLAFLAALWLTWRLAHHRLGEALAKRTVLVLAFFPSAIFSMAVYTESLFLLLTLAAFTAAEHERWATAGILGALAAATRNAGLVITAALAVEWWFKNRAHAQSRLGSAAWLLLPAGMFVVVQAYFRMRFGSVTLLAVQQAFGRAPSAPWVPIWRDLAILAKPQLSTFHLVTLLNVAPTIFAFVFAIVYRKRLAPSANVLMWGVMLMQLCFGKRSAPYTMSSMRFALGTTAMSEGTAIATLERMPRSVQLACAALGVLTSGFIAYLFGLKVFVS